MFCHKTFILNLFGLTVLSMMISCWHDINCLPDSHFDEEGNIIDVYKSDTAMQMQNPSRVKVYMEASGSMNGLYRAGKKTDFRDDVYQIVSYYLNDSDPVYILCKDKGTNGYVMPLPIFATAIKWQAFPVMGTTSIPDMIETVINQVDTTKNEVAILISDMKYDPDGANNINMLLGMYTTKIGHISAESQMAFSLVGATSAYYDSQNNLITDDSPYYYLIIGKSSNVAYIRDNISTILSKNGNFIENIETGMSYGGINYQIKSHSNCSVMSNQPTIYDIDDDEPCIFDVKLHLENFRWSLAETEKVKASFECKSLYGSKVSIDSITIDSTFVDKEKNLKRTMIASVRLNVSYIPNDCDVIEWTFNPCKLDTDVSKFAPLFGASSWKEFDKTFSLENFLQGLFRGANLNKCSQKPNYILISKHS